MGGFLFGAVWVVFRLGQCGWLFPLGSVGGFPLWGSLGGFPLGAVWAAFPKKASCESHSLQHVMFTAKGQCKHTDVYC